MSEGRLVTMVEGVLSLAGELEGIATRVSGVRPPSPPNITIEAHRGI
jgi:hypothetical protein